MRWGTGYDTEVRSYVNVIATPKGGTHVSGFETAMTQTFDEVMRSAKVLKVTTTTSSRTTCSRDDRGGDGAPGQAAVRGPDQGDPRHAGRSRVVRKVVSAELRRFLTSTKRAEKAQARLVMEKVLGAVQDPPRRAPAQGDPTPEERAGVLGTPGQAGGLPRQRQRPVRAVHRRGRQRPRHRQAGARLGYQALLPIRGKILNVQKASVGDMLKNVECASIIQVVGAGSAPHLRPRGPPLRPDHLHGRRRLRRRHIRCLLATLFFRYMPDLIAEARVYTAVPPLHRIELTNPKKGTEKYVYTYSDDELQRSSRS